MTVPFPYSGAPGEKIRPSLVLTTWSVGRLTDCLLCMITSQATGDPYSIKLTPSDVTPKTALHAISYIRPLYVYTADEMRIRRKIGTVKVEVADAVRGVIVSRL